MFAPTDCVSFLPPISYSEIKTQQKQPFGWLARNLHGIDWDTGNYPYIYLTQIIQSVRLRNQGAIFYAKGEEEVKFLSDLLEISITDLNTLACPSISVNYFTLNCQNHSKAKTFSRNIVQKKRPYSISTDLQMREELTKVEAPLSPSSTICALITGDGNLSLSISKDETIKTGNQFLQRKVKLLLTEDEIRSFTHLVYYIEPFSSVEKAECHKFNPESVLRDSY